MVDFEGKTGIRILNRPRDGRTGRNSRVGGGVSFAFNTGTCNFKIRQLKIIGREFEVLCTVGKIGKVERNVIVFTVYIPPGIAAATFERLVEGLAAEVLAAKGSYKNPIVVVNGDMNHKDLLSGLQEVEDFQVVKTGPTRGNSTIDLVYLNCPEAVTERLNAPPLTTPAGISSDHGCVYVGLSFPPTKNFEWVNLMRRTRDANREAAFATDMCQWDWTCLAAAQSVDDMASELERAVGVLTDKHFPLAKVRKRSNEAPWVTGRIRKLLKKKIRIYKKKGKSDQWWETDRNLQTKIQESRETFVTNLLEGGNNGKGFYAATKKLSAAGQAHQWSVGDLFPGMEPGEMCKEILGFYSQVSGQPSAPMPDLPRCDGGLGEFTPERTSDLLSAAKKSDSRVDGDPLAHLVRCYPGAFAFPVSIIFNEINRTGRWPRKWKTEHLTIIPKTPNPANLSECRNISCTSIYSKILEGVVLEKLRAELIPDNSQYGGIPKCGAEHMLIDIWDRVLEAMEGGSNASVLLGVDYEKAFNRMDHAVCISKLQRLGASPGSIALVRAFLEERVMTIKVNGCNTDPVSIFRGSPQGSVLGCLLYCVTTQLLTEDLGDTTAFLYVDDTTLFGAVPMADSTKHFTVDKSTAHFEGLQIGRSFDTLSQRADDIGMKINAKKTQLLLVAPPNGFATTGEFVAQSGDTVSSVDRLRLVGFTFGSSPNADAHVEALADKYKMKKWMLHHLRDAGFRGEVLFKLYCCYIRSIFEYCTPVYHSMLTSSQEHQLERLQRHAIRVCYGSEVPIEDVMATHCIETLKARRERRCDKFIRKAASNARFGTRWFKPRDGEDKNLRSRRQIQETRASSLRRFRSPLLFLQRRANELGITPPNADTIDV